MSKTKSRMKAVLIWVLIITSIFSQTTSVSAVESVDGGFSSDTQAMIDAYSDAYGWDPDLIGKDPEQSWTATIDGEEVTFNRQTGYQSQYYQDLITTTKQYLGMSLDLDYGSGGLGIVAVALNELALCEGGDPETIETNGDNNVKYNTWYYNNVPVSGSAYPWCCAFVVWCANQCGYVDSGLFMKTASSTTEYGYLTTKQGFSAYIASETTPAGGSAYTPVPGDIIYFYSASQTAANGYLTFDHTGIVVEVGSDSITTVEGNSSDKVSKCIYSKTSLSSSGGNVHTSLARIVHVVYPESDSSQPQQAAIYQALTGTYGYTAAGACGAIGNMMVESGCIPDITEYGRTWETGAGYGLIQWTNTKASGYDYDEGVLLSAGDEFYYQSGKRRTNLVNYCVTHGLDYKSLYGQLEYLDWELQTYYDSATYDSPYSTIKSEPNTAEGVADATKLWLKNIEGIWNGTYETRLGYAKEAFSTYYHGG